MVVVPLRSWCCSMGGSWASLSGARSCCGSHWFVGFGAFWARSGSGCPLWRGFPSFWSSAAACIRAVVGWILVALLKRVFKIF